MSRRSTNRTRRQSRSRASLSAVASRLLSAGRRLAAAESMGNDGLTAEERETARAAFMREAGSRKLPPDTLARADLVLEKLQGTSHTWTFPKGHRQAHA